MENVINLLDERLETFINSVNYYHFFSGLAKYMEWILNLPETQKVIKKLEIEKANTSPNFKIVQSIWDEYRYLNLARQAVTRPLAAKFEYERNHEDETLKLIDLSTDWQEIKKQWEIIQKRGFAAKWDQTKIDFLNLKDFRFYVHDFHLFIKHALELSNKDVDDSPKNIIYFSEKKGVYRIENGSEYVYPLKGGAFQIVKLLFISLQNGHPGPFLVKQLQKDNPYISTTIKRINRLCRKNLKISSDFVLHGRGYRLNTDKFNIKFLG